MTAPTAIKRTPKTPYTTDLLSAVSGFSGGSNDSVRSSPLMGVNERFLRSTKPISSNPGAEALAGTLAEPGCRFKSG